MRLLLVPALLLSACVPRDAPPDAAYRAFARAAAERDADEAWRLLSARTRAWMEARGRAAAAAAPGVVAASGPRLLLGDAALATAPVREIEVLRREGDAAVLRVVDAAGAAAEVRMVREGGAWRVELAEPR
ncbi:MAG TPA: hypothetical protein VH880_08540 [Anaeromyxobacteraceae bacterium]